MIFYRGWAWLFMPVLLITVYTALHKIFSQEYLDSHRWPTSLGILVWGGMIFTWGECSTEVIPFGN